jgi:hypothetical protein
LILANVDALCVGICVRIFPPARPEKSCHFRSVLCIR